MKRFQSLLSIMLISSLFAGCENTPTSGPVEVRWDRDVCERCVMAVSDPHFSAQIRGGPAGGEQKVYKFDDLGCAVIWLDKQDWKDSPDNEIWVNHYQTDEWIDAQTAHYIKDQLTPMNYGLGAQLEATPEALSFDEAKTHIYKIEEELNLHGGTVHHTPPASNESTRLN